MNAYEKGVKLERQVAKILRSKLNARVQRDRRSGAGVQKADINNFYGDLPLSIECKDQQTIKVREWSRQAKHAASFGQAPTLVFRMDDDLMACLPFDDLVNFLAEIQDLRSEISMLRKPNGDDKHDQSCHPQLLQQAVQARVNDGATTCANGHIVDNYGFCMTKGCVYSRGFRAKKEKSYVR